MLGSSLINKYRYRMASVSHHFELQRLYDLFFGCISDDDSITIDHYVDAYEEISKLLKLLGTVFSFVNSDVVEKIGILKEYRSSELGEEYKTIQSMINYEVQTKTTNNKKKASGSRTLLRLHRALDFITDFMKNVKTAEMDAKLSGIGAQSYDRTIAKHHPWLIRKGVHLAVYTLPTRIQFMEKLKVEDQSHTEELLGKVAELGHKIFEIVEKLYADNNLLDLP